MTPPSAADAERGQEQRDPERPRLVGQPLDQGDHQVRAHHVEAAVGEVDDAGDPEDQRHPHRDEEEEHPRR